MPDISDITARYAKRPQMSDEAREAQLAYVRSVSPDLTDEDIFRSMPWLRPPASESNG